MKRSEQWLKLKLELTDEQWQRIDRAMQREPDLDEKDQLLFAVNTLADDCIKALHEWKEEAPKETVSSLRMTLLSLGEVHKAFYPYDQWDDFQRHLRELRLI
ncbi:MAG: hypothetical protein HUJ26_19075 [Planctomycetaceae bacterium]|nr:hypothetical protein [Planctomycetaceae bacterium]